MHEREASGMSISLGCEDDLSQLLTSGLGYKIDYLKVVALLVPDTPRLAFLSAFLLLHMNRYSMLIAKPVLNSNCDPGLQQ